MGNILSCFRVKKPVIGVIHAKGTDDKDMMERAAREIDLYLENGVNGILTETYFGTSGTDDSRISAEIEIRRTLWCKLSQY